MAAEAVQPNEGRRYRGKSAEERRADQRQRLVRAAIEEFADRGYHKTSVEDIVRRAKTSRTAFYAFFDNRDDAMYGALQMSLRLLLDHVRAALYAAKPGDDLLGVAITAYVEYLAIDQSAAAITLMEARGASPEVNMLRSRTRRELADLVRDMWAEFDRPAAEGTYAQTISMGVLGIITESMLHLAEGGRLSEAPEHVPAVITAVNRVLGRPEENPAKTSRPHLA
ncbi:MAG: TetR/AcrR family transcriptional regulator [Actinomycetota bacterium]|nr:TetR/AcrR family transcriptional regulator [Actinomycetota bacterium]